MPSEINAAVIFPHEDVLSTSGTPNASESKKDKIKVVVRFRPVFDKAVKRSVIAIDNQSILIEEKDSLANKNISDVKRKKFFDDQYLTFDAVFPENATQEQVYHFTAESLVQDVISGYNGMIFAYGATGSGKTHTMMAMCYDDQGKIDYSKCGIVLQAFRDLFSTIKTQQSRCIVTISFMEIYNESIKDLFNTDSGCLELRGNNNIQIVGLSELVVTSTEQAISLLKKGNGIRAVRYTEANSVSSRSHVILIIVLRQNADQEEVSEFHNATRQSKLLFVDLAGSERAKHTKNKGVRLQEGSHINKSLLALGNCISALSTGTRAPHVNFRDSKLTRILREPLSGNYKTAMVAQINPAFEYREDIKNTLIFATKTKGVTKLVKKNITNYSNQTPRYQNLISELRDEVDRLKDKIKTQSKPQGESSDYENLQAKNLREQILSTFEERMKLRRELLDLDNQILILTSNAEKQHQNISNWQSKSNKLYLWRNSAAVRNNEEEDRIVGDNIDKAMKVLDYIEAERDILILKKNDLVEKLNQLKEKSIILENEFHINSDEDTEKELLKLFCQVHELEADKLSLQGERMTNVFELRRCNDLISRYQEQQIMSDNLITKQRQLIEENKFDIPMDLKVLYKLYQEIMYVTTSRKFNSRESVEKYDNNLPLLETNPLTVINNRKKKTLNVSHVRGSGENTTGSEGTVLSRLAKVRVDSSSSKENLRSLNPSPIPAAILFPPITF